MLDFGANVIFKNDEGTYNDEDIDKILERGKER